jgi:O-succinylbenzoic acid--CoA ligase
MIPTGGSSGQIRFAMHTWETLLASVQGFQQYFQQQQINACCVLSLYHVSGLMQFLRAFLSGGQLAIYSFKSVEAGQTVDLPTHQFFLSLVPTQLQRLLVNPQTCQWLSQFYTVLLGGAPAWPSLLLQAKQQGIRLAPTYGMTETASQVATLKPEDFLRDRLGCGQVLPHAKVLIYSEEGKQLGCNQTGIIQIQAHSLALGYYPHPWVGDNSAVYKTDDLGYLDEQGYLHVVGRTSNKIITGGENVYPAEVETAIYNTSLVKEVCVVGVPDEHWGQVIAAVYVPRAPEIPVFQLKAALANQISSFKQPKVWITIDQLPRNAQGKINIIQIQKIVVAHSRRSC